MCGFCHAMTAGEAERFYQQVHAGEVDTIPNHVGGRGTPRKDLPQRQLEELEMGAFEDAPAFRKALLKLCARADAKLLVRERNMGGLEMFWHRLNQRFYLDGEAFERKLVSLRAKYKRPVWSELEVRAAIATAAERRQADREFAVAMPAKASLRTVPRIAAN